MRLLFWLSSKLREYVCYCASAVINAELYELKQELTSTNSRIRTLEALLCGCEVLHSQDGTETLYIPRRVAICTTAWSSAPAFRGAVLSVGSVEQYGVFIKQEAPLGKRHTEEAALSVVSVGTGVRVITTNAGSQAIGVSIASQGVTIRERIFT